MCYRLKKAEATQIEAMNEKKEIEQKYRSEIDIAKVKHRSPDSRENQYPLGTLGITVFVFKIC